MGEIFGIIFRWVEYDTFLVHQRCVDVGIYQSSFDHEELVRAVFEVVTIVYGLHPASIIGWVHKGSFNTALAYAFLRFYGKSVDMPCISHSINHCGDNLAGYYSKPVIQDLNSLMSESNRARSYWRTAVGTSFKSVCKTRWWSLNECERDVFLNYDSMINFVRTAISVGRCVQCKRLTRLEESLNDPKQTPLLKLDLAIMDAVGRPLCQGTYMLEGDGPLIFIAHDVLQFLMTTFTNGMPDLSFSGVQDAIAECIAALHEVKKDPTNGHFADVSHDEIAASVLTYAHEVITPACRYLTEVFAVKLESFLHLFEVATLVNPFYVKDRHRCIRHVKYTSS